MHAPNILETRIHMNGFARVGAVIAVAAVAFVVWNIFSAHRAAAKLATATDDAAIVTVSTTHPKPTDPTGQRAGPARHACRPISMRRSTRAPAAT